MTEDTTPLVAGEPWPTSWKERTAAEIAADLTKQRKWCWEDLVRNFAFAADHPMKETLIDVWFDGKYD